MKDEQVNELLYQALETELGGVKVYDAAVRCAVNDDLEKEWQKYLDQTRTHVRVVTDLLERMGRDPNAETPGRRIVRDKAAALVRSIETARSAGDPAGAQLVAAEAVVDAETKDHANWELIGELAQKAGGETAALLKEAHAEVEEEEDEHLYHTKGWARELWMESLGLPAVLPPPEEEKHVTTAIGAARARLARDEMT